MKLSYSFYKLKVLIVEDEANVITYLKILMRDFSDNIFVAKTGKAAVEIFKNNQDIDIILMDIKMPEMNGFKATQKIREISKDVHIIAQTAYAMKGDREKALEAGCDDYISKPLDRDLIYTKVHTLIKNKTEKVN